MLRYYESRRQSYVNGWQRFAGEMFATFSGSVFTLSLPMIRTVMNVRFRFFRRNRSELKSSTSQESTSTRWSNCRPAFQNPRRPNARPTCVQRAGKARLSDQRRRGPTSREESQRQTACSSTTSGSNEQSALSQKHRIRLKFFGLGESLNRYIPLGLTGNHLVAYYIGMDMDEVFRALGDASRRQLLDRLYAKNGQTLMELSEGLAMSRQAVTKHLDILEQANLVVTQKQGRNKLHYLNPVPINEISERWIGKFEISRLQTLSKLKKQLEGESDD